MTSEAALASVHPMVCQLYNQANQPVQDPMVIYARRGSKDYKISDDGAIVAIIWRWFDDPVEIHLEHNEHYPWSIPFGTKTIKKQTFRHQPDGNVNAVFPLDEVEQGLKLSCTTAL